jgi:hypothetical protein
LYDLGMAEKLCPVCGAYWKCDCVIPAPPPEPPPASPLRQRRTEVDPHDLIIDARSTVTEPVCEHDWVDAVGVELDEDIGIEEARVLICRLCGLYAVEQGADQ